jgi:hypothetical protein
MFIESNYYRIRNNKFGITNLIEAYKIFTINKHLYIITLYTKIPNIRCDITSKSGATYHLSYNAIREMYSDSKGFRMSFVFLWSNHCCVHCPCTFPYFISQLSIFSTINNNIYTCLARSKQKGKIISE